MKNKINKNIKKGGIGGLITIISSILATLLIKKSGLETDTEPVITGAIAAVLLGIIDSIKHR